MPAADVPTQPNLRRHQHPKRGRVEHMQTKKRPTGKERRKGERAPRERIRGRSTEKEEEAGDHLQSPLALLLDPLNCLKPKKHPTNQPTNESIEPICLCLFVLCGERSIAVLPSPRLNLSMSPLFPPSPNQPRERERERWEEWRTLADRRLSVCALLSLFLSRHFRGIKKECRQKEGRLSL